MGEGWIGAKEVIVDAECTRSVLQHSFWSDVLIFDSLGSTNDHLKVLAESGAPEGTVVIAREQAAGKGRLGRTWASPVGGAWLSGLLKPAVPVEQAGCISILLAVSLAQALRERWRVPVGVKWPNDLYVRNQKLGGILIELSSQTEQIKWLVAGIGINVNNDPPKNVRVPATSLAHELGAKISLDEFCSVALDAVARDYRRFLIEGFESVRDRWRALSILSQRVSVLSHSQFLEAEVVGLSEIGKLVVHTSQGYRELAAEEVTLVQL